MTAKRLIMAEAKVSPEQLSETEASLKDIAAAFR